jgi:hypothetical protein
MSNVLLRQLLNEYFNEGELREICFDLHVDYEDLGGRDCRPWRAYREYNGSGGTTVPIVGELIEMRPGLSSLLSYLHSRLLVSLRERGRDCRPC